MNSMTGLGSASGRDRDHDIEVEVRSVNHRFFTLKQSLPEGLSRHEDEIERIVRSRAARGSLNLNVSVKAGKHAPPALPDVGTFRAYHRRLCRIGRSIGAAGKPTMSDLLAIPPLWAECGAPGSDPSLWPCVRKLVEEAADALAATRRREGAAISRDLRARLKAVEGLLARIRGRVPASLRAYRRKLDSRVREILFQKGLEPSRVDLAKEIALHADRCDISEEIQRLQAHIAEFRKVLGGAGQRGRRLDFLSQEMAREANTLASKGNDAEISSRAVAVKTEIEKIKEQVENVE